MLKAIPCVLYVDEDNAVNLENLIKTMDDNPIRVKGWTILPDLSERVYEVGSYKTPWGGVPYKADVKLAYVDPAEADPDTKAGSYPVEVEAKNSFEAAQLAFDWFHENHPIGNLEAADIDVNVERAK